MKLRTIVLALLLGAMATVACAETEMNAQIVQTWLEKFAEEAAAMQPRNDVSATADPARPGEYLLEYAFGTVVASAPQMTDAQSILRIELTTPEVTDCRGAAVGHTLEAALGGLQVLETNAPLTVISTQESGYGWCWAYASQDGVYGVEWITYGGDDMDMKEYTLTYVIDDGWISAIRIQVADATLAQAADGFKTAEEIASRQRGQVLIKKNQRQTFAQTDMTLKNRPAVGIPVDEAIAMLGEPKEIQTLPGGMGRVLVYEQMVAELAFDEMTGVEYVRAISCASGEMEGPRGLIIGMALDAAAACFRCDENVSAAGGALYLDGEAMGDAPYGMLIDDGDGMMTLRYACVMENGASGLLDIVSDDGVVTSWNLYVQTTEAAYDG